MIGAPIETAMAALRSGTANKRQRPADKPPFSQEAGLQFCCQKHFWFEEKLYYPKCTNSMTPLKSRKARTISAPH